MVTQSQSFGHRVRSTAISRRAALRLGLSAAGVAALAACGEDGGGDGGGGSTSGSTVRFTWWGNDVRQRITQEAIDLFHESNSGVTVEAEPGSWDGYWDKLATTVAAGSAPDVMQQVDPHITEYAQRGALADLGQFGDTLDLSPFGADLLESSTIDGKVYAVPIGMTALAVWVNPAAFEAAGQELPDDGSWSWDEYASLCAEISQATDGEIRGSGQLALTHQPFQIFVRQQGEDLYTTDGVGFTKDTLVQWWEYVLRLQESGAALGAQESVEEQGKTTEQTAIVTGDVAFSIGWASQISQTQEAGDVELRLLQLPGESTSAHRGILVKPSMHYSISATSDNAEAAAELIDFLVNNAEAGEVLGTDRGIPTNGEVFEAVRPDLNDGDTKAADYLEIANELATSGMPAPPAGASAITEAFPRFTQEVLFERTSPAEAADGLIAELETALA
ncbi:ABC transporter substrate-binding protein [Phytoactinopolyspora endophytica]|uniref:ABC transporter substrate-binding protein n=1 Tax=Phytoactinopolyspora endophytica TaxID=1642495 RepID=UPI0013ED3E0F|nr:extracellular solute-binding protein [Phytoactinopolyspora endophytica]